jgi:hypothetical protein
MKKITKFIQHVLTYVASPVQTPIHLTMYPNIDKYLWNCLEKFKLNPMVGFGVMFNSVKIDGRKFYAKI